MSLQRAGSAAEQQQIVITRSGAGDLNLAGRKPPPPHLETHIPYQRVARCGPAREPCWKRIRSIPSHAYVLRHGAGEGDVVAGTHPLVVVREADGFEAEIRPRDGCQPVCAVDIFEI